MDLLNEVFCALSPTMKINEHLKLVARNIVLVPYESKHVERYHEWMKSEELQTLTASEPLSLEQEYEMQQAWRNDENKCTFIVLDKSKYHGSVSTEIESMVGDVNLFFNEADDNTTAEIEIMIAEPLARGRGFGKEALLCMMIFGFEELSIRRYTAKIGYSNETSLKMFSKLGFTEVSRSEVFKEVTLELRVMDSVIADFLQGSELYCHEEYTHT